jgi:seryl-tRNA synthetase
MIDLTLLRSNPETIKNLLKRKEPSFDIDRLIELDGSVRAVRQNVEELRHKKNELATQGKSGVTEQLRTESIRVSKELKEQEAILQDLEKEFRELYLSCPNVPFEDIPVGFKESNKVVKTYKEKPSFSFTPKHHLELATAAGWLDFERATILAGSNFALYRGDGARMLYALAMMMLKNNIKHGFEPIIPPFIVNEKSLEVSSNFPKFRDQVYAIPEDQLYMSPTSEVGLANMYRNAVLSAQELPIHMTAWTSCFRREAGGYGSLERGLIRIHQFEKVELFTLCEPENSNDELDRMIACAEVILQKLDLHYRISLLAAQDCSFASAKTFDIEVWLPGQNAYYEVSSCSNCTDFQSRRGMIRYKKHADGKTELVHTLNASSLALPRLMVALIETYQKEDGTIELPEVLKKEMELLMG